MAGTLAELKQAIREAALARRDGLDPGFRAESSEKLRQAAKALRIDAGAIVAGFWPIRSEIDIRPLMLALRADGARLCLPAILDAETIVFREWLEGANLIGMRLDTAGPGEDAETLDPTILLVPLAAFDNAGRRIGYGGGYYDRAIARMSQKGLVPRIIGAAFDCQQVDRIPSEPHDVPLHEILTESGLRKLPS